jgi:DnaJ-class molecular chaperone
MDYYQTLGVAENASQDEIKQAYKKLAMKNHPDRGGDTNKFQEISQAYDTLGDAQKRTQYDAQKNGFNPFSHNMGGGFQDVGEMFSFAFGPGFAGFNQRRKNRDLSIRVKITFKQSFTGTQVEARFNTPSGKSQNVVIDIPPGVQSGQTIRYGGLGDDSVPNLPRGDLNVTIVVEVDTKWERRGNDIYTKLPINILEAMIGCTKDIECIDGYKMNINLRPGIQPGTEFTSGGRGFKELNTGRAGNLYVIIDVEIPAVADATLKRELEKLYSKINSVS